MFMHTDFGKLFQLSHGLLATVTPEGFFDLLNPAWEATLGFSLEELRAKPFLDFVHPDDRQRTDAEAQQLFTGVDTIHFENRYCCKDGSYKWLLWTARVDMRDEFKDRRIYATASDITLLKETQQKLETALSKAEQFRSLIQATSDFVGIADLHGKVTYVNEAGLKLSGRAGEDVCGESMFTFVPKDYGERLVQEGIPGVTKHNLWEAIGELRHRDGSLIPMSQVIVPIRDREGNMVALGTIIRDIRGFKALEAELLAQKERLSSTLQAMSTPLIPITNDIVVIPLIGTMDAERAERVMEAALTGVQRSQAKVLILDVTGLAMVDSYVASALVRAANAVKLLGARTTLTGIQPAVAQTLVQMGLDLEGITTHGTLQSAIAMALRANKRPVAR